MTGESEQFKEGTEQIAEALIQFARSQGWRISFQEVLDVLYLASMYPGDELYAVEPESPVLPPEPGNKTPGKPEIDSPFTPLTPLRTEKFSNDTDRLVDLYPRGTTMPRPSGSQVLQAPAPPALPRKREFLQALRPLLKRGESRVFTEIDINQTVKMWTEENLWELVERSVLERQLELVLVLDAGPSMDVWESSLRELNQLFRNSGAFRSVRTYWLSGDEKQFFLSSHPPRTVEAPMQPFSLAASTPGGPICCLIATDCVSPYWWRNENWLRCLDEWAQLAPTSILQVLPEGLWDRTSIGQAGNSRLHATRELVPISRLWNEELPSFLSQASSGKYTNMPLPVAPLFRPQGLNRMAQVLAGQGNTFISACRFRLGCTPAATSPTPAERLEFFDNTASAPARRLIGYLAAAPAISLPICRIIESMFLRDNAGPLVEAEIWLSGLLSPLEGVEEFPDPEAVLYRFDDEVREELLSRVSRGMSREILARTSTFIETNLGRLQGLPSMLKAPEKNAGKWQTSTTGDPIARIAASILKRHGHDLAGLVASKTTPTTPLELTTSADYHQFHISQTRIARFEWSPDGHQLAIPAQNGKLYFWHPDSSEIQEMHASDHGINAVSWSPDGTQVALACYSRVVWVIDAREKKHLYELKGSRSDLTCVAWSPDGQRVAAGSVGGNIRIWETASQNRLIRHFLDPGGVWALRWLAEEKLAVGTKTRTVIVSTTTDDSPIRDIPMPWAARSFGLVSLEKIKWDIPETVENLGSHETLWSGRKNGWILAAGGTSGAVCFWDLDNWVMLEKELFIHEHSITSLSVDHTGKFLASCSRDGKVRVVNLTTLEIVAGTEGERHDSPYSTVGFNSYRPILAAVQGDLSEIRLFDAAFSKANDEPTPATIKDFGPKEDSSNSFSEESEYEPLQRIKPIQLAGNQIENLRDILVQSYSRDGLDQLIRHELVLRLDKIVAPGPLYRQVFDLMVWAEQEGRIEELILAVLRDKPENSQIQALAKDLGLPTSVSVAAVALLSRSQSAISQVENLLPELSYFERGMRGWLHKLETACNRVCRVCYLGRQISTGFLVGPDLVLTVSHAFAQIGNEQDAGQLDPTAISCLFGRYKLDGQGEEGFSTHVAQDWLVADSPVHPRELDRTADQAEILPSINELDYKLIRLEREIGREPVDQSASGPIRGWFELNRKDLSIQANTLLILYFTEGPLTLSAERNPGLRLNSNSTRVWYDVETESASSGGPCFDENWNLIAMHHARGWQGQRVRKRGIPINVIRENLERKDIFLDFYK